MDALAATRERRHVEVRGIVQGVGFRPFVYRLARELALDGWVRNDGAGVTIEVEGGDRGIAEFVRRLRADAPPRARVDRVLCADRVASDARGFAIVESGTGRASTTIGPDSAVCADCIAEMLDPADRRWKAAGAEH